MNFNWNEDKNKKLQEERGITFEEIENAILNGGLLDDMEHPRLERKHQRMLIVQIEGYTYCVPYITEENGSYFLKTAFKSRKARKDYLKLRSTPQ